MKLLDICKFTNNQNNKLNLPCVNYKNIICKKTCRFKDFDKIYISDGLYYLDDRWQYVLIKNNNLSLRVEFFDPSDLLPNTIWINEIDLTKSIIKHYNYNPYTNSIKKLICVIPINLSEHVYNFIDILFFSGYTITEPYEFGIIKDNLGNDVVILKEGVIFKY